MKRSGSSGLILQIRIISTEHHSKCMTFDLLSLALSLSLPLSLSLSLSLSGTSIIQVTARDADDSTYGNSARLVYAITRGQDQFSVDPQTGLVVHRETTSPGSDPSDPLRPGSDPLRPLRPPQARLRPLTS